VLDLVLQRVQVDRIGRARITNNGVGAEGETARRCNEAAAPVSKTVTIAFHRDRGLRHQMIWTLTVPQASHRPGQDRGIQMRSGSSVQADSNGQNENSFGV
jgi:hypothetical protein